MPQKMHYYLRPVCLHGCTQFGQENQILVSCLFKRQQMEAKSGQLKKTHRLGLCASAFGGNIEIYNLKIKLTLYATLLLTTVYHMQLDQTAKFSGN